MNEHRARQFEMAIAIFAVALLGLSQALQAFPPPILDDPHITFRYAENIAAGQGFVYNSGERVLGTSTPLYALFLSIPAAMGVPAPWAGSVLETIAALLIGILIIDLFRRIGQILLGSLMVALLATAGRYLYFEGAGMEMALHFASIMMIFALLERGKPGIACGLVWMPVMLRPEGFLVVIPVLWILWRKRRDWDEHRRTVYIGSGITGAVLLSWALFAWLYFGHLIPHSVLAKRVLYAKWSYNTFADSMMRNFVWPIDLYHLRVPLVWLGLVFGWMKNPLIRPLYFWITLHIVFFTLSGAPSFGWYAFPVHVVSFIAIGHGLWALVVFAGGVLRRPLAIAYASLMMVALMKKDFEISHEMLSHDHSSFKRYERVGEWIRENTPEDTTVASMEIGVVGYISERPILDLVGLVSPEMIPHLNDKTYQERLLYFRPDCFVFAATTEAEARRPGLGLSGDLRSEYTEVHREVYDGFGRHHLVTVVLMRNDLLSDSD